MNKRDLRECKNCDMKVPETNEHFFEVCTKHDPFRTELKNSIDDSLKNAGIEFNTINLLGMNEKIMRSKRLRKKNKKWLLMIFGHVLMFMNKTKRFGL